MHKNYLTLLALSFGIVILIVVSLTTKPLELSSNPTVAASIFPIYDITQNIAGEEVNVELILSAGASPHTYAPSPSDIRNLQNAEVIYTIGAGLDDWSKIITESLGIESYVLAPKVLTIQEGFGAIDPHYWLSIDNAVLISDTVLTDLSERFPESADTFTENHKNYVLDLEKTKVSIVEMLDGVENKNLLTFHDSFAYFAAEYGFNIVGSFEPTAGREPTPQELVQLTQLIEELEVSVIYSEPQLSTAPLEAFLTDNNIEVKVLDPIGGATASIPSYINLMLHNAQVISQNQ